MVKERGKVHMVVQGKMDGLWFMDGGQQHGQGRLDVDGRRLGWLFG